MQNFDGIEKYQFNVKGGDVILVSVLPSDFLPATIAEIENQYNEYYPGNAPWHVVEYKKVIHYG